MTEAEWIQAADPQPMLDFLRGKASERKLRLFACACCRRIWHALPEDEWERNLVELSERFADGQVSQEEVETAHEQTEPVLESLAMGVRGTRLAAGHDPAAIPNVIALHKKAGAYSAAATAVHPIAMEAAMGAADASATASLEFAQPLGRLDREVLRLPLPWRWFSRWSPGRLLGHTHTALERRWQPERREQAALLRDIFGNPFRSISIDPSWLTWHDGLLVSMAQHMYDSRDFSDMPVLGDALEEAGCTDQDILAHCRQPGEHVRGCWVVDLILGKK